MLESSQILAWLPLATDKELRAITRAANKILASRRPVSNNVGAQQFTNYLVANIPGFAYPVKAPPATWIVLARDLDTLGLKLVDMPEFAAMVQYQGWYMADPSFTRLRRLWPSFCEQWGKWSKTKSELREYEVL